MATESYAAALLILKVLLWKALYDYYHHWTALDPIAVVESLCIQTTTGLRPCLYHCMYLQHCQCVWSSFIIGFKEYLKFFHLFSFLYNFTRYLVKVQSFTNCHQKLCHIILRLAAPLTDSLIVLTLIFPMAWIPCYQACW